jgi:UDP-N-acetyl-D-galactosamine dehydrogenase
LVNEFHQIFEKLNINTKEVIEAAGTKWNFMKLQPGLVGGHCISVDPYYLLHKSQSSGYVPDLIRKAREINDFMPAYLAQDFLKKLIKEKINPVNCKVGLLGFTFKENCPDIRNTKVYDLYKALVELGLEVEIFDPWANVAEVKREYDIDLCSNYEGDGINAFLLAVGHKELLERCLKIQQTKYVYDYKGLLAL